MSVAFDRASPPRGGKRPSSLDLLDAPNQGAIRADLAIFFGPNADVFLQLYEKMRAATGAKRIAPRSWNWAGFLLTFVWFFYRKMYGLGVGLMLIPVVLGYLLGTPGGAGWAAIWVMCGQSSKGWYVKIGLDRIMKADKLGLTGADRYDYLQRAGGVSLTGGLFAGLIYVVCVMFVVAVISAAFARHSHVGH